MWKKRVFSAPFETKNGGEKKTSDKISKSHLYLFMRLAANLKLTVGIISNIDDSWSKISMIFYVAVGFRQIWTGQRNSMDKSWPQYSSCIPELNTPLYLNLRNFGKTVLRSKRQHEYALLFVFFLANIPQTLGRSQVTVFFPDSGSHRPSVELLLPSWLSLYNRSNVTSRPAKPWEEGKARQSLTPEKTPERRRRRRRSTLRWFHSKLLPKLSLLRGPNKFFTLRTGPGLQLAGNGRRTVGRMRTSVHQMQGSNGIK